MTPQLSPPDLTVEECAKHCRVSAATIKRDIAEGKLVATKYRAGLRIAVADFEEYRKKCRSAGMAEGGKSAFNMPGGVLAELLKIAETPSTSRRRGSVGSRTQGRVVQFPAHSKTRSTSG